MFERGGCAAIFHIGLKCFASARRDALKDAGGGDRPRIGGAAERCSTKPLRRLRSQRI